MWHNRRALGIGLLATVVLAAACGGDDEPTSSPESMASGTDKALVDGACEEGKLQVFQLSVTPAVTDVNAEFGKAYPCIDVSSFQGTSGAVLARYESVHNTGNDPDILSLSLAGLMSGMAEDGDFLEYTPTVDGEVAALADGHVYTVTYNQMGVIYNENAVSESDIENLVEWSDIADPAFDDLRIGFISPAAGGTAATAFYYLVNELGEDFVRDFFSSHEVTVYSGAQPGAEAVASGQIDMAVSMARSAALGLWSQDAPVRFAVPSPEILTATSVGIPAGAANPNAAKLYADFLLSADAQRIYDVQNSMLPGNESVEPENEVVNESWWQEPEEVYEYDPAAVDDAVESMTKLFDSVS